MQGVETRWADADIGSPGRFRDRLSSWKRQVLAATCYRRLNLYVDDLTREDSSYLGTGSGLAVRRLTEADAGPLAECRPGSSPRAALRSLRSGDDCVGIFEGGRLLGYVWSTTRRTRVSYVDLRVYLERDTAYSYELYVRPDERGKGVAGRLLAERRALLREMGFQRVVSAVMPWNEPSAKLQRSGGGRFLGVIDVRFFLGWRRGRIRYAPGASVLAPLRLLEV